MVIPRCGKAITVLGEVRLTNFLHATALKSADPAGNWKAMQRSARTFSLRCGSGCYLRQWRASFKACGKVQAL